MSGRRTGEGGSGAYGVVVPGAGEGARFTALPWVRAQMREKLGFEPYPGTLNLRFRGRALDLLLSHGDPCEPVWIEPQPGFCAARCYPAVVGGRVVGAVVVPEIGDYPEDVAEVVAPVCIRDALGLQDGDRVSLRVGVAAVTGRRAPGGTGAGDGHRPGAPGVPAR